MTSRRKLGLEDLGTALVLTDRRSATGTTRTTVEKRSASTTSTPASMVSTRPVVPTTPAVRLVSGTVTHFNADKGFGFAHAVVNGKHETVYFHANHAKKVTGTADNPELTREKHDNVHVLANAGSNNTEIVMVVRPAREEGKKPMAIAWGIRPKRDWRDDAINFDNGYADYVGGHVTIARQHGSYDTEEFRGTIQAIKFTHGEINLVIADAEHYDPTTDKWTSSDKVAVCYPLKYAHLDAKNERTPERNRRKIIIAPSMHDKGKQIRIILSKPSPIEQLRAALA